MLFKLDIRYMQKTAHNGYLTKTSISLFNKPLSYIPLVSTPSINVRKSYSLSFSNSTHKNIAAVFIISRFLCYSVDNIYICHTATLSRR